MPGVYTPANPDPEGSRQWRVLVSTIGKQAALLTHPELHARHVEHRRWLSHTRESSTTAHRPSKSRQLAPQPVPREVVPLKPILIELPLPEGARKTEMTGTWNLPEFTRIGNFIFRTEELLDERRLQPERVRRRKARLDK